MPRVNPAYITAYNLGRRAYRLGLRSQDNPYLGHIESPRSSERRRHWFDGYYDEQRWHKYGPNPREPFDRLPGHRYATCYEPVTLPQ